MESLIFMALEGCYDRKSETPGLNQAIKKRVNILSKGV
jgi:hypothetical protein